MDAPTIEAGRAREYGRLAGWLFIGGALLSLPSSALLDPPADATYYLMTLLGIATGLACLRLRWERYPAKVFHLVALVATVEVAAVVALFDPLYSYFLFLIAVYIAYVYPSWRDVLPQVALTSFVLCLPLLYEDDPRGLLPFVVFAIPVLVTGAAMVAYLRAELERNMRRNLHLAGEASELASRINRTLRRRAAGELES
jgi:hypothetical protein